MEPHRAESDEEREFSAGGEGRGDRRRRKRRRDQLPLDARWLEDEAMRVIARYEKTKHGLEQALERRVRARCRRTGEDAEPIRAEIPAIAARLEARGYVDDRRTGRQLVDRLRRQGRSKAWIRIKLDTAGIDRHLAAELLRAEDTTSERETELEAAFRFARRRRIGPFSREPAERAPRRERHLAMLGRQGFSFEIALAVIDAEPDEAAV